MLMDLVFMVIETLTKAGEGQRGSERLVACTGKDCICQSENTAHAWLGFFVCLFHLFNLGSEIINFIFYI